MILFVFSFVVTLKFQLSDCSKKVLILNALDLGGLYHVRNFVDAFNKLGMQEVEITIFSPATEIVPTKLSKYNITSFSTKPMNNLNIGRRNITEEKVTSILQSLRFTKMLPKTTPIIILSFAKASWVSPTPSFINIFDHFNATQTSAADMNHIVLLKKTSRWTSMSDWHDFAVESRKTIVEV